MASNVVGGQDFPVAGQKFGIGLSWDAAGGGYGSGGKKLDLDLQAIAFDTSGKLMDAVYYNSMKALGKALTHSGDEQTGDKGGYDEIIWANLGKLPEQCQLLVFVVAAFSGGHLKDARNGRFHILQDTISNEVGKFRLEESDEEVDIVGALIRSSGTQWTFRLVDLPAQDGRHFIDILEPTIGNFVREVIPGAPRRLKAAFAMEKGDVVDMPRSDMLTHVTAGLGWDTGSEDIDLDVSVIVYERGNNMLGTIFFGNLEGFGLKHSGDNLTGEGDGDDETIEVSLPRIDSKAQSLVFVVNIYTRGKTFAEVKKPYCRIVDPDGSEFCRYELSEAGRDNGLVVARLFRGAGDRWSFQAIGQPVPGNTWKDSLPRIPSLLPPLPA